MHFNKHIKSVFQVKYLVVSFLGMIFSLIIWKIMGIEFRFVLALSGAIILFSIGMALIYCITDYLIYLLVFNTPFSYFTKLFLPQPVVAPANGLTLGLSDLMLFGAYLVWFAQIFIARLEPLPKIRRIDFLIFALIFVQTLSIIGAPSRIQGILVLIYTIKHALIYFFIAHKIKRFHLKWVIIILLFAILIESPVAFYERLTGNVGIARAKGKIESSEFQQQYQVPGLEQIRAEGSTGDSHELGLYYTMLLPVPFVFMLMPSVTPFIRFLLAGTFAIGAGGFIVTFSRSGWMSFALASIFALGVIIFSWKQRGAVALVVLMILIISLLYPQAYSYVYNRIFDAPPELITARLEMNRTAIEIWRKNFLLGYGPGNYQNALRDPNIHGQVVSGEKIEELPVHNAFLYTAAEQGLLGAIAFFGIILIAMYQCYRVLRCEDFLIRALAIAVLTALIGYMLDGITDPLFRMPVVYAQLWIYIGLSMSFDRMLREGEPSGVQL